MKPKPKTLIPRRRAYHAYCFATGVIEFGRYPDDRSLPIFVVHEKDKARLEKVICAIARHAYDGKTLLVPGIPEARDENARVEALIAFCREVKKRVVPLEAA